MAMATGTRRARSTRDGRLKGRRSLSSHFLDCVASAMASVLRPRCPGMCPPMCLPARRVWHWGVALRVAQCVVRTSAIADASSVPSLSCESLLPTKRHRTRRSSPGQSGSASYGGGMGQSRRPHQGCLRAPRCWSTSSRLHRRRRRLRRSGDTLI